MNDHDDMVKNKEEENYHEVLICDINLTQEFWYIALPLWSKIFAPGFDTFAEYKKYNGFRKNSPLLSSDQTNIYKKKNMNWV